MRPRDIASAHHFEDVLTARTPRCSCGGELKLTGEVRDAQGWRTAFKLQCRNCGKNWVYSGGVYKEETATTGA